MNVQQIKKDTPIFATELPKEILKEIDKWIIDCKKIKNHKLSYLKQHENTGTEGNDYQVSIPRKHIDDGFFLPYLLRFCAKAFGGTHRDYYIRDWNGHFDGYDIWANFSYKGNYNPSHNHTGHLSGVIYYKNKDITPTHFPDEKAIYGGDEKTMLVFPSHMIHFVEKQTSAKERITIAFNLGKAGAIERLINK